MSFSLLELNIPVWIFLGMYFFYLLFYLIYGIFNLIHLLEYGRVGTPLFAIVVCFIGGTILLVASSLFWLFRYDLSYSVSLNETIEILKNNFLNHGGF